MDFSVLSDSTDAEDRRQPIKRSVPWSEPAEFIQVYECLYNPEITKKRWALDQISVWNTRSYPSLPTAIEASYEFADAIVQDVLLNNGTTLCQERHIIRMYSLALVRFVNLIIELHKTEHRFQAIRNVANLLGIPTWIVDLRNDATHSNLPSLSHLRLGAEAAMKYLDESYWSIEAAKVKVLVNEPDNYEATKNLILNYQVLRYEIMHAENRSTENGEHKTNISQVLKQIQKQVRTKKEHFFKVLGENGLFIMTAEDLRLILTDTELSNFQDEDKDEKELLSPVLPPILEKFWAPLFYILLEFEEVPLFLEYMLRAPRHEDLLCQKLLVSWVIKVIKLSMVPCIETSYLRRAFRDKCVKFNWNRLLMATLVNPCKYTPFLLPIIFSNLNLDTDYMRQIMMLVAIHQGQALDDEERLVSPDLSAFTVEKLIQSKKVQNKRKSRKCLWTIDKVSEGEDFTNIPIGATINALVEEYEDSSDDVASVDLVEDFEYTEKFILCNENDSVKMETTVEQNTLETDAVVIANRSRFIYRKK